MTETTDAEAATPRSSRAIAVVRRLPATFTMVGLILLVGVIWQCLWRPFEDTPLWDVVAYGLPAFEDGRWWTVFTGTFFVDHPLTYLFVIPSFVGMAFVEFTRGSRLALTYYWLGQLFAICASALLLSWLRLLPWPWAIEQATMLDVGASGGSMACLAAAAGILRAPWRVRAWLVLLAFSFVALLFWGKLADLEHALAVLLVLATDRSLRVRHTTVREQRLLAFVAVLMIGAIDLMTTIVPTDGMFGQTHTTSGPWIDTVFNVAVVVAIAHGLRLGRRWSWVVAIVLASLNVLLAALIVVGVQVTKGQIEGNIGDVDAALAQSVLWLLLLIYLVWVRSAFTATRKTSIGREPKPTVDDVKRMLHDHGGGTLSWMTTWDGNEYARTTDGIVAHQRRANVALALADPLGPEASRAQSVAEFIDASQRAGLIPCFFSASQATRDAIPAGWRSLVVADDTIVDLDGLAFTGKRWAHVRAALNRSDRQQVRFQLSRLADLTWGQRQQLHAISESWVGDKGLPEMKFTLGTLDEAADPEVRVAVAMSPNGDIEGFLSWLPIYGTGGRVRGWSLDLMRRRDDGAFGPVMEFLIGSSARAFADEGAEIMSLSGAPLAHDYPPDAGAIADLSDWLAGVLEPVYGFQSLHKFKEKFNPRYETMYLLFRDEGDLARIGAALTRAFLPDATLRQFAGAGLEIVRGAGE